MEKHGLLESLKAWEGNAAFWDAQMGDASNRFHREVVRPGVTELLQPQAGERILEIACGNGNYAAFLAERGVSVTAFDYSPKMIALARARRAKYDTQIDFRVVDATNAAQLAALRDERLYDKAVSNMAVMDITDIEPLFAALHDLLLPGGCFVFATQHPCFVTLTEQYLTAHSYRDIAIEGQPLLQCYYHRSLQDIFAACFHHGFVIDGFLEESYNGKERPDVIIVRARRQ